MPHNEINAKKTDGQMVELAVEMVQAHRWVDQDAWADFWDGGQANPYYQTVFPLSMNGARQDAHRLADVLMRVGVMGVRLLGPYEMYTDNAAIGFVKEPALVLVCDKYSFRRHLYRAIGRDNLAA